MQIMDHTRIDKILAFERLR